MVAYVLAGRLACKVYDGIKKEAASLKIQANLRCHLARRKYTNIKLAGVVLQTGMRSMAARKEFRYRRQTTAATLLQVINLLLIFVALYSMSILLLTGKDVCRPIGVVIEPSHTIRNL